MTAGFDMTKIVVLDTEYTSWEGCIDNGWDNNNGQYREIVQIAAVRGNPQSAEIEDTFDELVRPQINPELSDYLTTLTGIQQEDVATAEPFESIVRSFLEWVGTCRVYTWGEEVRILDKNIALYDSDIDLNENQFVDIRAFLEAYGIPVDQYTSGTVSEFFDAAPENGSSHDALYDCQSIFATLHEAQLRFETACKY